MQIMYVQIVQPVHGGGSKAQNSNTQGLRTIFDLCYFIMYWDGWDLLRYYSDSIPQMKSQDDLEYYQWTILQMLEIIFTNKVEIHVLKLEILNGIPKRLL